jgi:AcrR family transcriptional regulator
MVVTEVSRRTTRTERRRARERTIVGATRSLFDERGRRDAPIDEIARAARLNKALIYRSFDSKEEIFVLTLTDYLDELSARIEEPAAPGDPALALGELCGTYADFCLEYPAFLDCALALMQRPAGELRDLLSGAVLFRLGRSIAGCIGPLERILASGSQEGVFVIDEPAFTANRLITQILGSMHLARAGVGIREASPGVAASFQITPAEVRDACARDALALVSATKRARS